MFSVDGGTVTVSLNPVVFFVPEHGVSCRSSCIVSTSLGITSVETEVYTCRPMRDETKFFSSAVTRSQMFE